MQPVSLPYMPIAIQKDLFVIIPAAGQGTRMGISDSKQFLPIAGIPVLVRTIRAFQAFQEQSGKAVHAVVVTNEENLERVSSLCREYELDVVEKIVPGGATRQDSVACGIRALASLERAPIAIDIVFIHDGARCLVDQDTLKNCFDGGVSFDVCVTGTACKNTIKRVVSGNSDPVSSGDLAPRPLLVDETLDRSTLYEVQTPQVFKYGVLTEVSEKASEQGLSATDDTALAEALGFSVHLIPGSYSNIKITTPEDAVIAEYLLSRTET